jgi:hypothetical protein
MLRHARDLANRRAAPRTGAGPATTTTNHPSTTDNPLFFRVFHGGIDVACIACIWKSADGLENVENDR